MRSGESPACPLHPQTLPRIDTHPYYVVDHIRESKGDPDDWRRHAGATGFAGRDDPSFRFAPADRRRPHTAARDYDLARIRSDSVRDEAGRGSASLTQVSEQMRAKAGELGGHAEEQDRASEPDSTSATFSMRSLQDHLRRAQESDSLDEVLRQLCGASGDATPGSLGGFEDPNTVRSRSIGVDLETIPSSIRERLCRATRWATAGSSPLSPL